MRAVGVLALWLAAGPACAQPLDAEGFSAFASGKTVTYGADGLVYGREEYRADRTVVWQAPGGDCSYGHWFEDDAGNICFLYGEGRDPVCWMFSDSGGRVTARSVDSPDAPPLGTLQIDDKPLVCPGPDVGV